MKKLSPPTGPHHKHWRHELRRASNSTDSASLPSNPASWVAFQSAHVFISTALHGTLALGQIVRLSSALVGFPIDN
eukprot:6207279-Pleurochrysis_carterae.AAC.2